MKAQQMHNEYQNAPDLIVEADEKKAFKVYFKLLFDFDVHFPVDVPVNGNSLSTVRPFHRYHKLYRRILH